MDNDQLLSEVRKRIENGEIGAGDLKSILQQVNSLDGEPLLDAPSRSSSRLSSILYYIGGGIVFMGLAILIAQQWDSFGPALRVFVTLGSAIAAFVVGVLFQSKPGAASASFFLVSALLMPLGVSVAYDEAGVTLSSAAVISQICAVLTLTYGMSYSVYRQMVLLVALLFFGTCLFFAVTDWVMFDAPVFRPSEYHNYRILAVGLSYMLVGHGLTQTRAQGLSGWLYGIGSFAFLGAALALGGWKPDQSWFWESVYPGLVFGILFLSVQLKSRSFLVFGSLALGCYLTKITAQYFADSLGWPLALVTVGFLLMGVAYLALKLSRTYWSPGGFEPSTNPD